jgi:hypothetical protein
MDEDETPTTPCKTCGKPMVWGEYEKLDDAGKATLVRVPLDPRAPVYRIVKHAADGTATIKRDHSAMVSHFSTCPQASQHSKGRRG